MGNFAAVFSIAKDLATLAIAVVGVGVAVRGLGTWGRQLRGGAEYDLARRLLKLTYELREEMNRCRRPFMLAQEMPPLPDEGFRVDDEMMTRHRRWAAGYDARWSRVVQARIALEGALLEAEVLWGEEVRSRCQDFIDVVRQLGRWVVLHVQTEQPGDLGRVRGALEAQLEAMGQMASPMVVGEADPFGDTMRDAIGKFEVLLKPHLRRGSGIQTSILDDLRDVFTARTDSKSN